MDIHAAPTVNQGFCTSQSSEECRPEGMIQVAMLDPFTVSQLNSRSLRDERSSCRDNSFDVFSNGGSSFSV